MEKEIVLPDYNLIANIKTEVLQKISKLDDQPPEYYKLELENAYKMLLFQIDVNLVILKQTEALAAQVRDVNRQASSLESRFNKTRKSRGKSLIT